MVKSHLNLVAVSSCNLCHLVESMFLVQAKASKCRISVMVNFLLMKIFRGNRNEAISTNDITSPRFQRKIFVKRKLAFSFE